MKKAGPFRDRPVLSQEIKLKFAAQRYAIHPRFQNEGRARSGAQCRGKCNAAGDGIGKIGDPAFDTPPVIGITDPEAKVDFDITVLHIKGKQGGGVNRGPNAAGGGDLCGAWQDNRLC